MRQRCQRFRLIGALAVCWIGVTGIVVGASASAASTQPPTQLLVRFTAGTSDSDADDAERAVGATHVGDVYGLGVRVLHVPSDRADQALDALQHNPHVDYAEPDGVAEVTMTPNDTYWPQQWGPAKISLPTAWDTTTGASSTVVAILDTGVDFTHPDLQGRFVAGYDFVNNDSDPTDDHGHGTETAGILGAASNNARGVAGVCWSCSVMPVKVATSSGSASWSVVSSGITWATDHGARVISMSLAGSTGSTTLQSAVQYAQDHGVVVVAGAGNNGTTSPSYPAAYSGVVSVAASDSSDHLYSWSSYGSWVDVAAPGCDYTTMLGGGYASSFCGTSAATPVVAGIAGLLASADPSATVANIETAIETSAVPIGSAVAYGRVDAAAALTALGQAPAPSPSPSPSPTPATTTATFTGSLNGKASTRSYSVTTGAGTVSAALSFTKASSMAVQLDDSSGAVIASASGSSPVQLTADVSNGAYTFVVTGPSRASFTLTVTYPNP